MVDLTTSNFDMKSQRINLLKLATLISLLLIVSAIAFSWLTKSKPQNNEININDSVINPTENENTISKRDSIVNYGKELLGTPYVEAGSDTNGFDCSGFVYYVFKHFRIEVPRSSPQYENFGKEVPIENVKKGDILVFLSPTNNTVIGHLGIVTNPKGMESDFIHSTSGREMKVVITSLKVEGYKRRFVKAISVIN
ncbi:MAG: C40 family peptidase [Flavobacterium sp.]|uniref:C40 family peptidase n=1 Tax=Flavobacterium sp. TaxID=239 RepID=UPI003267C7A3